jgi:hypothetical protein
MDDGFTCEVIVGGGIFGGDIAGLIGMGQSLAGFSLYPQIN